MEESYCRIVVSKIYWNESNAVVVMVETHYYAKSSSPSCRWRTQLQENCCIGK